jgi:UDP-N-acetylmuramyl pentapeptide phosphotransferase/UDP-N-acetylglucosamine-1-phosphate transferase
MPTPAQPLDLFPPLHELEPVIWPGFALLLFVVSGVATDIIILLATRLRLVDLPNRRSAHALPTARGGGLAITLTATVAAIAVALRWPGMASAVLVGTLLPCLAIATCGMIDDIRPLNALLRLGLQVGAALAITTILGPLEELGLPGLFTLPLGPLAWPLTVVWIVGLTNAFNFMDGVDGMAATGAVVGGMAVGAIGFWLWAPVPMIFGACVAAAAGGFLVFNWQPARIFMGDVGSGFLGILFAALPLLFPERFRTIVLLPVAMALWPYIYDPFISVLRRVAGGHNPLKPHREFLFHRLVRSGWSHAATTLLYAFLAGLGGCAAIASVDDRVPQGLRIVLAVAPAALAIGLTAGVELHCTRRVLAPAGASLHNPKD